MLDQDHLDLELTDRNKRPQLKVSDQNSPKPSVPTDVLKAAVNLVIEKTIVTTNVVVLTKLQL
jgi:hypothetical protein